MQFNYSYSQSKNSRVLWNKAANLPVQFATIESGNNYTISNEDAVFELENTSKKITIQNISYEI